MFTRDTIAAFFDELEKIADSGLPAPSTITQINQPMRAGAALPAPSTMVRGNATHVPWGQSQTAARLATRRAGRNIAMMSTQAVTPIRAAVGKVLKAAA